MAGERLTHEQILEIAAAPREMTASELAGRLGVCEATIRIHRAAMRREAAEAARSIRAEYTRQHVRSALEDLSDARRMAREDYEDARTKGKLATPQLRAWLEAIRQEIADVAPDPRSMSDDELRHALIEAAGRVVPEVLAVDVPYTMIESDEGEGEHGEATSVRD